MEVGLSVINLSQHGLRGFHPELNNGGVGIIKTDRLNHLWNQKDL